MNERLNWMNYTVPIFTVHTKGRVMEGKREEDRDGEGERGARKKERERGRLREREECACLCEEPGKSLFQIRV